MSGKAAAASEGLAGKPCEGKLAWAAPPGGHRSTSRAIAESEADDDEALARRLQEQEDALASRGRATRGSTRVTQKGPPAQRGSGAQQDPATRAGAALRSSSRLKPPTQAKQRPSTRATAGLPRTFCL